MLSDSLEISSSLFTEDIIKNKVWSSEAVVSLALILLNNKWTCTWRGRCRLQLKWDKTETAGSETRTAPTTWRGIHPETARSREWVQFITSSG